jgi:D-alanyl-lipoteichoic acid acyltransferase DltB (MBOAT superfamily)
LVFNSLTFLAFFAVVLIVHQLPLSWTLKKVNLLLASYLFYAAWNPPFVLLLFISACADYFLARKMARLESLIARRSLLAVSLTLNLGLLGFFKYGNFIRGNFAAFAGTIGIHYNPPPLDIILPLGISFYTFETVSYLIDVYRRRIEPWKSFLDYALFLTFFPHLVAGPIVRARDFLPQCAQPRKASATQFEWGTFMMAVGLFEKVLLADAILAPVADRTYTAVQQAGFVDAWVGTLAFAGQIFFDFAGYSTCGIGAALCLGFVLNDNFRYPYAAVGFRDFWQRWHVSLSSWLRDYLYIPLGGNREGAVRTQANLMFTMLVGGLWHGASWRFVAWGALHGLYLVGERGLEWLFGSNGQLLRKGPVQVVLMLVTFVLVCATWVFFRASSFNDAFHLLAMMFRLSMGRFLVSPRDVQWVLLITVILLAGHWIMREWSMEEAIGRLPWWARATVLAVLAFCLMLAPGDTRAFIYFQF